MSKYNKFINSTENDKRIHFQEWIGENIIFNGAINQTTGFGIGRIFRFEEEIDLDANDNIDGINLIVNKYFNSKADRKE